MHQLVNTLIVVRKNDSLYRLGWHPVLLNGDFKAVEWNM